MGDAVSNARKEYEESAEWLEAKGWKRVRWNPVGHSSYFVDPLDPENKLWIQEAIEVQQKREAAVADVMEA